MSKKIQHLLGSALALAVLLFAGCQLPDDWENGGTGTARPPGSGAPVTSSRRSLPPTSRPAPPPNYQSPSLCRIRPHANVDDLGMCSAQGMLDIPDEGVQFQDSMGLKQAVEAMENPDAGTAAISVRYKWRTRNLRVAFRDDPFGLSGNVLSTANRWNSDGGANLVFVPARGWSESDIRVTFKGTGYWSMIGTVAADHPGAITMSLSFKKRPSAEEFRRVVLHEFGHAIGLVHEHRQPLANIQWDRHNVLRYYSGPPNCWSVGTIQSQVLDPLPSAGLHFTAFDPFSIMAYGVHSSLTQNRQGVPWNSDLSPTDKKFIASQYPK